MRAVLVDQSGSAIKYTCPQLTQRKHSHWLTATAKRTNIRTLLNLLQLQTFRVLHIAFSSLPFVIFSGSTSKHTENSVGGNKLLIYKQARFCRDL